MTENETAKLETPPPPPQGPPPTPPSAADPPQNRWRDRRVGVVTLAASTVAALVIGGLFGTAAGGLVGYGLGHHNSRPDGPEISRMHWPEGGSQGYPERPQLLPPDQLPPGLAPERPEESSGSES